MVGFQMMSLPLLPLEGSHPELALSLAPRGGHFTGHCQVDADALRRGQPCSALTPSWSARCLVWTDGETGCHVSVLTLDSPALQPSPQWFLADPAEPTSAVQGKHFNVCSLLPGGFSGPAGAECWALAEGVALGQEKDGLLKSPYSTYGRLYMEGQVRKLDVERVTGEACWERYNKPSFSFLYWWGGTGWKKNISCEQTLYLKFPDTEKKS